MEEKNEIIEEKKEEQRKEEPIPQYKDVLLNKIKMETMHEIYLKKFSYLKGLRDMLQLYQESCNDFTKKLISLNNSFASIVNTDKTLKGVNNVCNEIYSALLFQKDYYKNLSQNVGNSISNLPRDIKNLFYEKDERDLYNLEKNILKEYNNSKNTLIKSQNDYYLNLQNLEKMFRDIEEKKVDKNKIDGKIKKTIDNIQLMKNKYLHSIKAINMKKEEKRKIERHLLQIYQGCDVDSLNKIQEAIGKFLYYLKSANEENRKIIENLYQKYTQINIIKDLNEYIQEKQSLSTIDENFEFTPYDPQAKLNKDYVGTNEKETEELNINYRILYYLKKVQNDICPDINMEEEKKKYTLRILTKKLYDSNLINPKTDPNLIFSNDDKKQLISLLDTQANRTYLIISLSNQRTKGRYQRSWKQINNLGDILNHILKYSEKEKNYDDAKHCIIISQTFFSEEKKTKKKFYLFELIKNNKWLKSLNFWDEFTNVMIQRDIENNNKILGKEALEKEPLEQKKERISQVCLSQLLTFSENMVDFKLDKNDIFKIIDKKIEKFEIIDSFKNLIYENIYNVLKDRESKQHHFVEDEISYFVRIRQRSIKKYKKQININNMIFNANNKNNNINNTKIRDKSWDIFNRKFVMEKNRVIDNIKKEINKNKNDLVISKKTKSEGIPKGKNLAKSCINLNKERNKNDKKNNMKIIDTVVKNEIKEEKEEEENKKTEDKKEGDKNEIKEEEKKDENKIEDINEIKEDKKE